MGCRVEMTTLMNADTGVHISAIILVLPGQYTCRLAHIGLP